MEAIMTADELDNLSEDEKLAIDLEYEVLGVVEFSRKYNLRSATVMARFSRQPTARPHMQIYTPLSRAGKAPDEMEWPTGSGNKHTYDVLAKMINISKNCLIQRLHRMGHDIDRIMREAKPAGAGGRPAGVKYGEGKPARKKVKKVKTATPVNHPYETTDILTRDQKNLIQLRAWQEAGAAPEQLAFRAKTLRGAN